MPNQKILNRIVITVIIAATLILSSCASQPTKRINSFEGFLNGLSSRFAEYALNTDKLKISVMTFQSTKSGVEDEEFSVYIAESISSKVAMESSQISLFERKRLELIFEENQLSLSGIIDSSQAKEIGRIAPVDAILSGSYTVLDDSIDVNCRLVDVTTGEILFTHYDRFIKSDNTSSILNGNKNQNNKDLEIKNDLLTSDLDVNNTPLLKELPNSSTLELSNEILYINNLSADFKLNLEDIPWNKIPLAFRDRRGNASDNRKSSDLTGIQLTYDDENLYFAFHTAGPIDREETDYQMNIGFSKIWEEAKYDVSVQKINTTGISIARKIFDYQNQRDEIYNGSSILYSNGITGSVPLDKLGLNKGDSIWILPYVGNGTDEVQLLTIEEFLLSNTEIIDIFMHSGWNEIIYRAISIDGELDDWKGINSVYAGREKNLDPNKTIKNIYISKDREFLYLCMELFADKPADDETTFSFNLQNYREWEVGDLEISYRVWDNSWRNQWNRYLGNDNWESISVPGSYGKAGRIIEMKVPLEMIINPNSFSLYGYTGNDDTGMIDNTGNISFVY